MSSTTALESHEWKYRLTIQPGVVVTVGDKGLTIYSDEPFHVDGGGSVMTVPDDRGSIGRH
jgi:hypothetical protein